MGIYCYSSSPIQIKKKVKLLDNQKNIRNFANSIF